jgi:hypothetical protein
MPLARTVRREALKRQGRQVETWRSTYEVPPGLSRPDGDVREKDQPRRGFVGLALGFNPGSGARARRWAASALVLVLLLASLAACSSGSAREAERARSEEETAQSVVAGRQATYTATLVAQATATPVPPRAPSIAALVLTNQVNGDGSPVGEYEGFASNAGTIYLCAQLSGRREGKMAVALRDASDQHNVLAYNEVDVDAGSGTGWVAIPVQLDGSLAPGDYPIWLIFNPGEDDEEWIGSIVFTVGSAGSGARQVGNGGGFSQREASDQNDSLNPGNQSSSNDDDDDDGGGNSPPIQPRD